MAETTFITTASIVKLTKEAAELASIDQGFWQVLDMEQVEEDVYEYTCYKLEGQHKGIQGRWLGEDLELVRQGLCGCIPAEV